MRIKVKNLKVADFNIREKSVKLQLEFRSERDHAVTWTTSFEDPELESHKIVMEMKKSVKNSYRESNDEIPSVEIDEKDVQRRLIKKLEEVKYLAGQVFVKNSANGFIELIDKLKNYKSEI